jgi:hypothetical protein
MPRPRAKLAEFAGFVEVFPVVVAQELGLVVVVEYVVVVEMAQPA